MAWWSPDERIRRLEDELYTARRTIVSLLPEATQRLLGSYYDCETRRDARVWEANAVDRIIESAAILERSEGSYWGPRAYCPLCGSGSSSPYERGFTVPEGLRRHLIGWGNSAACNVLDAAFQLARNYWEPRLQKAEEAAEAERQALLADRRNHEPLFLLGADRPPVLFDEAIQLGRAPRDEASRQWAIERLASLGFSEKVDGRVRSYVREAGEFVVYADPRVNGELQFHVYCRAKPTKRGRQRRPAECHTFSLADRLKNDLESKVEASLETGSRVLSRRRG